MFVEKSVKLNAYISSIEKSEEKKKRPANIYRDATFMH